MDGADEFDLKLLNFNEMSNATAWKQLFAYLFIFGGSKAIKSRIVPFERGFFCDDLSIRYPFRESTVPMKWAYTLGYGANLLAIILIETGWLAHHFACQKRHPLYIVIAKYLRNFTNSVFAFLFGGICAMLLTDMGKFTIGRLRPHFLDVCQPDWTNITCACTRYITEYSCTGDEGLIRDARLSFPSGHSSLAFYTAMFLTLYINIRVPKNPLFLIVPFISLIAAAVAFFVALSRVSDNKHHPTDVLAGSTIGILCACYAHTLLLPNAFMLKNKRRTGRE